MLSACIFFVPVPCLAEADAALMVVKYELISADLMLDPAHISIAKQGGWLLYSCCINSSLLRVAFKPHISLVASYIHVYKWNLEIHVSGRAGSEKHVDQRRSLLFLISHYAFCICWHILRLNAAWRSFPQQVLASRKSHHDMLILSALSKAHRMIKMVQQDPSRSEWLKQLCYVSFVGSIPALVESLSHTFSKRS